MYQNLIRAYFSSSTINQEMDHNLTVSEIQTILEDLNNETFKLMLPSVIFYSSITVIGAAGNSFAIYIITTHMASTFQNRMLIFLSSLSVFACVINLPADIVEVRNLYMQTSETLCKLSRFLNTFVMSALSDILVVVAVHRYKNVKRLKRLQSKSLPYIGGIVLFSLLVSLFALLVYGLRPSDTNIPGVTGIDCKASGDHWTFVFYTIIALGFVTLVVVTVVCYCRISTLVKKSRDRVASHATGTSHATSINLLQHIPVTNSNFLSKTGVKSNKSTFTGECEKPIDHDSSDRKHRSIRHNIHICLRKICCKKSRIMPVNQTCGNKGEESVKNITNEVEIIDDDANFQQNKETLSLSRSLSLSRRQSYSAIMKQFCADTFPALFKTNSEPLQYTDSSVATVPSTVSKAQKSNQSIFKTSPKKSGDKTNLEVLQYNIDRKSPICLLPSDVNKTTKTMGFKSGDKSNPENSNTDNISSMSTVSSTEGKTPNANKTIFKISRKGLDNTNLVPCQYTNTDSKISLGTESATASKAADSSTSRPNTSPGPSNVDNGKRTAHRTASMTAFILAFALILSYAPFFFVAIPLAIKLDVSTQYENRGLYLNFIYIASRSYFIMPAINPFIYYASNLEFRRKCKMLWKR